MCFTPLSKNGFRRSLLDGAILVGFLGSLRLNPVNIIGDSGRSMLAFSPVMRGVSCSSISPWMCHRRSSPKTCLLVVLEKGWLNPTRIPVVDCCWCLSGWIFPSVSLRHESVNQKKSLAAVAGFLLSTATAAALDDCSMSFLCQVRSKAAAHR